MKSMVDRSTPMQQSPIVESKVHALSHRKEWFMDHLKPGLLYMVEHGTFPDMESVADKKTSEGVMDVAKDRPVLIIAVNKERKDVIVLPVTHTYMPNRGCVEGYFFELPYYGVEGENAKRMWVIFRPIRLSMDSLEISNSQYYGALANLAEPNSCEFFKAVLTRFRTEWGLSGESFHVTDYVKTSDDNVKLKEALNKTQEKYVRARETIDNLNNHIRLLNEENTKLKDDLKLANVDLDDFRRITISSRRYSYLETEWLEKNWKQYSNYEELTNAFNEHFATLRRRDSICRKLRKLGLEYDNKD